MFKRPENSLSKKNYEARHDMATTLCARAVAVSMKDDAPIHGAATHAEVYWRWVCDGLSSVYKNEEPRSRVMEWLEEGPASVNYWAAAGYSDGYNSGFHKWKDQMEFVAELDELSAHWADLYGPPEIPGEVSQNLYEIMIAK